MAAAIPSAAKMSERVQKTEDAHTRVKIRRAIKEQYGTMNTSVVVAAGNSATIAAELAAQGYTASHADGQWTITWTNASDVANSTIGRQFDRADVAKEKSTKSGKMYICDEIVKAIRIAASKQQRTVTATLVHNAEVQTMLTAQGYTVSHDGTDWTVTF